MTLTAALDKLAVRLLDWSANDFIREMEADCRLLSLIGQHNRSIGGFVSWNKNLSSADRICLARAMTLLFHKNAQKLKGEVITEEIESWAEAWYEQTRIHMDRLPPLATADRNAPTFVLPDAGSLLDILSSTHSPIIGKPNWHGSRIVCTRYLYDWKITTEFIHMPREENLVLEHQFIRKDGQPVLEIGHGPFPRSLLTMYGIYNRTTVAVPSQADLESMANAMLKIAEHFISQAGPLFVGLGIDD